MQLRWNFKLIPNVGQVEIIQQWLLSLRKHRNYALRERIQGWESNNKDSESELGTGVLYTLGSSCCLETKLESGAYYPLTCPIQPHGVIPSDTALLTKQSGGTIKWDSAGGIQSKVTTQLRATNQYFAAIDSAVLQRNLANLDTAFTNFWKQGRGFPRFLKVLNSFEYKPGRVKLRGLASNYGMVYLPSLGDVKFHNSRDLSQIQEIRTCTLTRKADSYYLSMLVTLPGETPQPNPNPKSAVGIDVGINKLVALSDGSMHENIEVTTNTKTARRLAIRSTAASKKQLGSKNQKRAYQKLAKQRHKLYLKRDGYNWQTAAKIVSTADVVVREDLNIKNMVKRAKPKHDGRGGYQRNNATGKSGLNKRIQDCGWGDIIGKIAWLTTKSGKLLVAVDPRHTSQECPKCGHTEKANRTGEKFVCRNCGHAEHADTGASRKIAKKGGLSFPPNQKRLPAGCGKVTLSILKKDINTLCIEAKNLNLSVNSLAEKKGDRKNIKKASGESPCL